MDTSFKQVNTEGVPVPQKGKEEMASFSAYDTRKQDSGSGIQSILIAVVVMMFLASGGVFAWQSTLESSIGDKKNELEAKQKQIESFRLSEVKNVPAKLHIAKEVVESYPFVINIFEILEHSVSSGVVYSSFSTRNDVTANSYSVEVIGTAPGYHTLIQQIDILKNDPTIKKYFTDTELISFSLNSKGKVDFSLKIKSNIKNIDPDYVGVQLSESKAKFSNLEDTDTATSTKEAVAPKKETTLIVTTKKTGSSSVVPASSGQGTLTDIDSEGI